MMLNEMASSGWKTINGAHVFIEDGQSIESAFAKAASYSGKKNIKEKSSAEIVDDAKRLKEKKKKSSNDLGELVREFGVSNKKLEYKKKVNVKPDEIDDYILSHEGLIQLRELLKVNRSDIEYNKDSKMFTVYTGADPSNKKGVDISKPSKIFYKLAGATKTKTTYVEKKSGKILDQTTNFYAWNGDKLKFEIVGTKL